MSQSIRQGNSHATDFDTIKLVQTSSMWILTISIQTSEDVCLIVEWVAVAKSCIFVIEAPNFGKKLIKWNSLKNHRETSCLFTGNFFLNSFNFCKDPYKRSQTGIFLAFFSDMVNLNHLNSIRIPKYSTDIWTGAF